MTARVSLSMFFRRTAGSSPGGWCLFFMLCGPCRGEEVSGQQTAHSADIDEFDSRLLDSLGINIDLGLASPVPTSSPDATSLDITINGKQRGMSQQVEVRAGRIPGRLYSVFIRDQLTQWGLLVDTSCPIRRWPAATPERLHQRWEPWRPAPVSPSIWPVWERAPQSALQASISVRARRGLMWGQEQRCRGSLRPRRLRNANPITASRSTGSYRAAASTSTLASTLAPGACATTAPWQGNQSGGYQSLNSCVQRDVTSRTAQLTRGVISTLATASDSVPFTGVQIASSDDAMLPDFERGSPRGAMGWPRAMPGGIRQGSAPHL